MTPRFMARVTESMNLPWSETQKTVVGVGFRKNLRNLGLEGVGFSYLFNIQVEESSWIPRPRTQTGLGQKKI